MIDVMGLFVGVILRLFRARQRLVLENLALRQQLTTLKRTHPRLSAFDLSRSIPHRNRDAFLVQELAGLGRAGITSESP
jgi:hypothetical protein